MTAPDALDAALQAARGYLAGLPGRPVGARASLAELRAALGGPLPQEGTDAARVVTELARNADGGIVATAGPRYFGFVVGGSVPAALATDWLVSTWDQNAGIYALSPAAAVVEEVTVHWLLELFGLPSSASVGFVTGCQMAHVTCLAAARHALLRKAGWDVEQQGLYGAPEIDVVVGGEAHITIFAALRYLGLGAARVRTVPVDGQGRMRPDKLREALAGTIGPMIVCAQAGNVNTGAFDPFDDIAAVTRERGAWLHVDGAFGLWAATSPTCRALTKGLERADSWATDAHKWLNVPYDSGIAIVADGAFGGHGLHGGLHREIRGRPARPRRLDPRVLAARARVCGVCGDQVAGATRSERHDRAQLRRSQKHGGSPASGAWRRSPQ